MVRSHLDEKRIHQKYSWYTMQTDNEQHTTLNLSLRGSHPLKTTTPPNFLSVVSPVNRLIAPPWLKPPRTTRSAGMPESTSVVISSLRDRIDFSIPGSSSSLKSKDGISNLSLELASGNPANAMCSPRWHLRPHIRCHWHDWSILEIMIFCDVRRAALVLTHEGAPT